MYLGYFSNVGGHRVARRMHSLFAKNNNNGGKGLFCQLDCNIARYGITNQSKTS